MKSTLQTSKHVKRILAIILTLGLCFTTLVFNVQAAYENANQNGQTNSASNNGKGNGSGSNNGIGPGSNSGNANEKKNYIIGTRTDAGADQIIANSLGRGKKVGHNKRLLTTELTPEEAQSLANDSNVLYIEENFIVEANDDDVPPADQFLEWNIEAVGANVAHEQGYKGSGVKIAILDSGMEKWFAMGLAGRKDFVLESEDEDADDLTGHGTAVAGIIGAPYDDEGFIGVAPEASIYAVKVLDGANASPVSRIIIGIDWCINNGINIINMSFGTGNYSIALDNKIQEAIQNNILVIASAGNNGQNGGLQYPARYDGVLAVASVGPDMQRVSTSATGEGLAIAAPGDLVRSTGLFGGAAVVNGTSIAAPHVSGAAAVLLAKNPHADTAFIRALIEASAKPLGSVDEYGAGLLDLARALEIYDEFAENYANPSYVSPKNHNDVQEFDDEVNYVNGVWGAGNHGSIINEMTGIGATDMAFVKAVSNLMDSDASFQGKNFGHVHVHPGYNYVVSTRFIYHVVRFYRGISTTNVMTTKPAYLTTSEWNDIKGSLNTLFGKTVGGRTGNTNANKAWMAMGALGHMVGDIYAHAAIVNATGKGQFSSSHFVTAKAAGADIYHPSTNNTKNDNRIMHEHLHTNLYHWAATPGVNLQTPWQCRCFRCFNRAVDLGVVTTIKIMTFYNQSTTINGSLYEDNASFMPVRLTKAKSYWKKLIADLLANNAFPMRAMSSADFKLERFVEYATCNGENTASVKGWTDLNTQKNRSTLICNKSGCNMHNNNFTNCLCKAHKTALIGSDLRWVTKNPNPLAANRFDHYVNTSFGCTYNP